MTEREILDKIERIEKQVEKKIKEYFIPGIDLGDKLVTVEDITFDRPKLFDLDYEIDLKDRGGSLTGNVKGSIVVKNKNTGKVISKSKPRTLVTLPYLTNRGTYIVGGKEKVISKQMRLKPGVYTYDKDSKVQSLMFLERGKNLYFEFDPEEFNLKVVIDGRTINAITFLRILGISDQEISAAINDRKIELPLFRKAQNKNMDTEVSKLWSRLPCKYWHEGGKYPGKQVAAEDIKKYFFEISEFGETGSKVMNITLGYSANNLDKQVFLRTLKKVVDIAKADTQELKDSISDDRDDIRFQNVLADEDQIAFYVQDGLENFVRDFRIKLARTGKSPAEVYSHNKVSDSLSKFMSKGQLVDLVEQTNPLHLSASVRKITSLGEGGLKTDAASQGTRNLQNSSFGKIDPVETPESGKIGLVTHLAHKAKIKDLTIYSKYYKVSGGKFQRVKSNEVELEPLKEFNEYIAFYDPNTFKISGNTVTLPTKVTARYQGNIITDVPRTKITYVDISPNVIFGDATALIPFSAHNDGNRMLMGANMQKQALPLVNREVPLVQNAIDADKTETFEDKVANEYSFLVKAETAGTVTSVTKKAITVTDAKGQTHEHKLMNYFPLNMSHYIHNEPIVKVGDKVKKGQLMAEGWQTKDGKLALGTNVRIAYMPWKGYNFEDGYVISESLAKRMGTEEVKVESIAIKDHQIGGPGSGVKEVLSRLNIPQENLDKLDEDGIIKEGEEVTSGTILVGIVEKMNELEERPERRFAKQVLGVNLEDNYKNKSEVIEGYLNGRVIRVKKIPQSAGDLSYIINVTIFMSNPLKEGDKLAGRHGNKGIITKIERDEDMPIAEDGKPIELIYSPLGVPSRKNLGQLYEVNAGLVAEKTGKPYKVYNFDKSEVQKLEKDLSEIGFPDGKMKVFDPETGKPYDNKVTVGTAYIMKLKHKVDDKLQARNLGRINFLYNTPVKTMGERAGEKENPQKWGEMEMRALQASKAVNLIDEATRLKADAAGDEKQRAAIFNALTFGGLNQVAGDVPESLKIFKDYTTALGINVKPLYNGKEVQSLDSRFNSLAALPLKESDVQKLSRGEVREAKMFVALMSGDQTEEGGLFDPKIFGETPDQQRTYWGHIKLAMPMPNPVFLTSNINPYAYLLGLKNDDIKTILTDKVGVITNPGETGYGKFQIVPIDELDELTMEEKKFEYAVGGKALEAMLSEVDVNKEIAKTQAALLEANPKDKPKYMKKLRILNMLKENKMKPDDLLIKSLPVLPVGLRPFKRGEGSKQTLDDINKFYKDLIEVNNKIYPLTNKDTWEFTETDTKYKLLKDYYERLENIMGVNTKPVIGPGGQEVKGIMKRMKDKEGLIRGRLMSKFLDYSGRSVITVNPSLNLDEAGVPVDIAKKLYEPFVIRELIRTGKAKSQADAMDKAKDANDPDTWEALQKVVEDRPIILNRAPSLHKYSIQAFKPKLTKARAIELNPLVVTGFNADFDGDQMGVHVPLTDEAVKEANTLLLPSKNLINPTNGSLITPIKGEAILGLYYLTIDKYKGKMVTKNMAKKTYTTYEQLFQEYKTDKIGVYDIVILNNVPATVGQHLVNSHLPEEYRDYRRVLRQPTLTKLIEQMLTDDDKENKDKKGKSGGVQAAVVALNRLKDIGFLASTKSALSVGVFDLKTVKDRDKILEKADEIVTNDPSKIVPVYLQVQKELQEKTDKALGENNPMHMFMESGAKGSLGNTTKMTNMVGLSMDITGRTVPIPIKSSHKEGLNPAEMWVHVFDSRRGLADRALSTAEPGALTRDIWSSTQDAIVTEEDCGDTEGLFLALTNASILGRFLAQPVRDDKGSVVYRRNTLIDSSTKDALSSIKGLEGVHVRSPLTCKTVKGVCKKCYGTLPGTNQLPMIGEPVGILASQAIGEPTAQGTMKTFHGGGAEEGKVSTSQGFARVKELFSISENPKSKSILSPVDGRVTDVTKDVLNKVIVIQYNVDGKPKTQRIKVPLTREVLVKPGEFVTKGQRLTVSGGALSPREILEYKGLRDSQEYLVNELDKALEQNKIDRRHIELAVGKLTDKVRIDSSSASPWLPGQEALRSQVEKWNAENVGVKRSIPINDMIKIVGCKSGKTYKDHGGSVIVREGEIITQEILGKLMTLRIKNVEVYPTKIEYTNELLGVRKNPLHGTDNWFSQMGFQNIKVPLSEGAAMGKVDLLDEPRSRQMAGKLINIGSGYEKWKTEFDKMKANFKDTIAGLFD